MSSHILAIRPRIAVRSTRKPMCSQSADPIRGYCNQDDTFHTFGMWAHSLSAKTYKLLVDRGWRRSGMYLYRPNLKHSCCKLYTIKLEAQKFKPDKKQRQALNKFNRYVLGEEWSERIEQFEREADSTTATTHEAPGKKPVNPHKSPIFDLFSTIHSCEKPLPLRPAHDLEIITEPATFTPEKYRLYKEYQMAVHRQDEDEISASSFQRFLCESPIQAEPVTGRTHGYGSFHQRYMLDSKLIGLAVLDLLPGCVSSVYFAYSPEFAFLSLGRVSACREALFAVENGGAEADEYYMGYFVPSCPKMKYKGEYRPSHLLDPMALPLCASYRWFKLDAYEKIWRQRRQALDGDESIDYFVSLHDIDSDSKQEVNTDSKVPGTVFAVAMPGILPLSDVETIDLSKTQLLYDGGVEHAAYNRPWKQQTERYSGQIRDCIATMGPDVVSRAIFTIE